MTAADLALAAVETARAHRVETQEAAAAADRAWRGAIRRAVSAGTSQARVAEVAGITPMRVSQIVREE